MMRLFIVAVAAIGVILFVAFVVSRLLRSRTRGMSIRMQVFLALATIVGTFGLGVGVLVVDRVEARAVRLATQAAEDEAAALAGILSGELDRTARSIEELAARLDDERRRGADLRFVLLDAQKRVLFRPLGTPDPADAIVAVEAPVVVGGERRGTVRVVKPTVAVRKLIADFAPTVLVISLVLGGAAAVAAAMIGRAIAAPIEALGAFSERVSAGERTAAPPAAFGREVTRLARSLDSMRRKLEGRPFVETFAADLSHELKNPVAAIRASAEVLEESALDEPIEARRFVARIREATERIERLLSELLSLARIEARGAELFEPVELAGLAQRTLSTLGDGAARVELHAAGNASVRGDASWLSRAIANLVGNALVHSPPATAVTVLVRSVGDRVELSIQNSGEIPRYVRERLFRRFVTTRADKGGSGLGLAIVRAVAEAHGGRVELAQPGPPTVEFRLVLPAA
ncbi:MAG TPA: ATP-binding protein [Polyangiaceae bacterium]|nr:ATP-binding protein [Polyangiaceae bacterium]